MRDLDAYVRGCRAEFESKLKEWVEIPTVSAAPEHKSDIERCAGTVVSYLKALGAEAEAVPTAGNPVVLGRFRAGSNCQTVSVYNHLDVQPADEPQWTHSPFLFHKDGDRYIGRGSTDDKGPA